MHFYIRAYTNRSLRNEAKHKKLKLKIRTKFFVASFKKKYRLFTKLIPSLIIALENHFTFQRLRKIQMT